jgi:hypothetical protein
MAVRSILQVNELLDASICMIWLEQHLDSERFLCLHRGSAD